MSSIVLASRPRVRACRLASASYSSTKGTDTLISNALAPSIDNSLNEAPRRERRAEMNTLVSMTIRNFGTLVLYAIPASHGASQPMPLRNSQIVQPYRQRIPDLQHRLQQLARFRGIACHLDPDWVSPSRSRS